MKLRTRIIAAAKQRVATAFDNRQLIRDLAEVYWKEGIGHGAEGMGQRAEGIAQSAERRGQRAEGRGQRAEGRGQRAEGRGQVLFLAPRPSVLGPVLFDLRLFVHYILADLGIEFLDLHLSRHVALVLGGSIKMAGTGTGDELDFITHG
jgi:hypothetical protein